MIIKSTIQITVEVTVNENWSDATSIRQIRADSGEKAKSMLTSLLNNHNWVRVVRYDGPKTHIVESV